MRRWTLTLSLMIAAGVAVALAPRLLAAVGVPNLTVAPSPPPMTPDLHLLDTGVVEPVVVEPVATVAPAPPVPPIAEVAAPPHVAPVRPPPPPPRPVADPGLLIPELDEEPHVDWSSVPPPVAPAPDPTFWDDCPGCGMG